MGHFDLTHESDGDRDSTNQIHKNKSCDGITKLKTSFFEG